MWKVKLQSSTVDPPFRLQSLSLKEDTRISSGEVKFIEIRRNTKCEGMYLVQSWRWGAKAWGANGIRYPSSPCRKRCWLSPPYGTDSSKRSKPTAWGVQPQDRNSKELTGACTSGGACGLIRYYAQNLTNPWHMREFFVKANKIYLIQVLHGCRQLVPWGVRLSPQTSVTPSIHCETKLSIDKGYVLVCNCQWYIGGRRGSRQVRMALMDWATHVPQWQWQKDAMMRVGAKP